MLLDNCALKENERQLLESIINHIAVVLQRDRLVKKEAHAQALVESEKLKTALLQMVSHYFRSHLASIKASVSSLYDYNGDPFYRAPVHRETSKPGVGLG